MKNQTTDIKPTLHDTAEVLWEKFEKTGSIKAYMLFIQKLGKPAELVLSQNPS